MRPFRTKHDLVTLSVIDRVLQHESRFCERSARILHGSCSAPVRGLLFRRPGSWDHLNVEGLPMPGERGPLGPPLFETCPESLAQRARKLWENVRCPFWIEGIILRAVF